MGRGDTAQVSVFEPVGVAFEGDDLGVVDEPVDHGGGDHVVAEGLAPPAERLVAGHDEAGPLVPGGDELEEQVGGLGLEGDVADFIDLCGRPHRSIYADTATMPMCWFCVLSLKGSGLAVARHSYRLSRKASILSVGR